MSDVLVVIVSSEQGSESGGGTPGSKCPSRREFPMVAEGKSGLAGLEADLERRNLYVFLRRLNHENVC